mmetsp:Transcript_9320/g.22224  ORF Transcript_9320/g.22224 Transcript_9320/m.22224 type:complete len:185 (-) Transcript_9320:359-913(-)
MTDSPQVLPGFLRNLTQTSYREDFCLRAALQVQAKGGSGLVVCKPSTLPAPRTYESVQSEEADDDKMDFTNPRTPFLGRKVPLQSTYNSFCDDRGSLVAPHHRQSGTRGIAPKCLWDLWRRAPSSRLRRCCCRLTPKVCQADEEVSRTRRSSFAAKCCTWIPTLPDKRTRRRFSSKGGSSRARQ